MAKKIAVNALNAKTIDILNVIRQNASYDYQQNVPVVTQAHDIPAVGEVIYGTPAFANQFINALVNRIALVRAQSATFNNPYKVLKKGYLGFGETIESIFVNIAKVVDFNVEKAPAREFRRTLPDVRSAFHVMNWRAMYPITIQKQDLKRAFLSIEGVTDLIEQIVQSVYTAAEYDEFLLFKYMIIKAVSHGKMYPVGIDMTSTANAAKAFRGYSNNVTFMKSDYNAEGVMNNTPVERQTIFMDSFFNADFDVDVLSAAFHMDKADFIGRLFLIDDFTTFDNERFAVIRDASDGIEEVTPEELALMAHVKALLIDEDWFQVYDNENEMTDTQVNSGLYWNYFYHTWKTVSSNPFANAIVFVDNQADIADLESVTVEITDKSITEEAITLTLVPQIETAALKSTAINFIQGEEATRDGVAIHKYGAMLIPASQFATSYTLQLEINGTVYTATTTVSSTAQVGETITFTK